MSSVVATRRSAAVSVVRELRSRNRLLFAVAAVNLGLAAVFTGLLAVDGRTLLGRNVWLKPWKFAASIAVFAATLAWLLPSLSLGERRERWVSRIVAGAMLVEIALISAQAARGVPSHFNTSTPIDTAVFALMGGTITLSTLVVASVCWRTFRDPPALAPAYRWGVRLGLLVFVVASLEGGLMAARGSHAVGVPAGGPGLPLLNWSTTGGDLRVAHFVGLHALQVLPLTGYLAARRARSTRRSLLVVGIVAIAYATLVGIAFVQALLGLPVVPAVGVPSPTAW